ncbi:MAG TPA: HD-GYP domain-containing protein [Longimicrobiales bacterium]
MFAFLALALTFFLANTSVVGYLFVLRQKEKPFTVLRNLIGPAGSNLFYNLLASPVAVFAAVLYNQMYIGGLMLMVLPLLLIRYSYLSKIQLQHANQDLLRVLVKTIETRDPYTSGHSLRVSRIARAIAEDLGFSRRKVEQVETAALLHDVGKTDAIYASIIRKPTALTEEETAIIRTHAIKGAQMLEGLSSFPEEVIRGVRHHHERYDGRGYPDGLRGKEIPLAARIIMLCDSIDAMLSDRPYRPALTVEQVAEEVRRCAGSQFDPEIAEAIVRLDTINRVAAMIEEDATAARTPEPAGSL